MHHDAEPSSTEVLGYFLGGEGCMFSEVNPLSGLKKEQVFLLLKGYDYIVSYSS